MATDRLVLALTLGYRLGQGRCDRAGAEEVRAGEGEESFGGLGSTERSCARPEAQDYRQLRPRLGPGQHE